MVTSSQKKTVPEVEAAFLQIDRSFDEMFEACDTAEQKKRLRDMYSAAELAYWKAVAEHLAQGNTFVRDLRKDLAEANKQLKEALVDLQDVEAVLKIATEVVRLATAIAAIASL